jgi:hypothetical protein
MFANPWLWLVAAGALAAASWVWTHSYGPEASDGRIVVLALGLLCGGVGLWLRWNDGRAVYLRAWQAPLTLFLGLFFALASLGLIALFVASFRGYFSLHIAPMVLVLISAGPPIFYAALRCLKRSSTGPSGGPTSAEANRTEAVEQERSFAFIMMAVLCVIGVFTLYADPEDPTDWDTMRLFLRVAVAVNLFAAALTLVSTRLRRITLSILFLIHFAGINTAALSAPPAPWIIQQIWTRIFRPYLEFAYLNNAYHFYAPEPGPANYIWFRIVYEDPATKREDGLWYKIPELDEDGRNLHPVALDYQRFLSLTEGINSQAALPMEKIVNFQTGMLEDNPFWIDRQRLGNEAAITIGKPVSKHVRVPYHPGLYYSQQVKVPSDHAKRLMGSYARFVARKFAVHPDPDKANWKFRSVKIYQVVHWIPKVDWFVSEIPATDPDLYYPFYMGNYDAEGYLKNVPPGMPNPLPPDLERDPYLYWLLPSIRKNLNDPQSEIHDYCREHAGDPNFIRRGSDKRWVTPAERDQP